MDFPVFCYVNVDRWWSFSPHLIETFQFVFYPLYYIALLKKYIKKHYWNCLIWFFFLVPLSLLQNPVDYLKVMKKWKRFEKEKESQERKEILKRKREEKGLKSAECSKRRLRMKIRYDIWYMDSSQGKSECQGQMENRVRKCWVLCKTLLLHQCTSLMMYILLSPFVL